VKGIVFNLLEEAVTGAYGENAWDDLLETAGLDGSYTSLGNYPDQHLTVLVQAAAATTGESPQAIVRWFGRQALPALAVAYPGFFDPHEDVGSFLHTLNDIIHPEVRKLYPGADVPNFGFATADDGMITMRWPRSPDAKNASRGIPARTRPLALGCSLRLVQKPAA